MTSVSFVLGAGFSAPFNVPTMRPFLTEFRNFASRKYPNLENVLNKHFAKLENESDIEDLLSSLNKAEDLVSAMPPPCHMTPELSQWASDSRFLKSHLVSYIIERCEQFNRKRAEKEIAPLLNHLNNSRTLSEVHFFTTNYDRIMEYVAEYADIVLDDGFGNSQADLVAPWTRDFKNKCRLYKLHGSVTYYVDHQHSAAKKILRLDRGYPLPGPDFRLSLKGRELEPLMVLPTLEKDALDDPYSYLMHTFTATLSRGGLVVTMGTSLRDKHLVSAMNFSSMKIVVLVIDPDPESAIQRLPADVTSVALTADTSECLSVLSEPLVQLAERCASISDKSELSEEVYRFASEQDEMLRKWRAMTDEQREQINVLKGTGNDMDKIEAIHRLHGLSNIGVVEAVSALLTSEQSSEIRKAAAGCLGLSRNSDAVEVLANVATQDKSPDVRLESYLALCEIGDIEATEALESARSTWPEDPFFSQEGAT